MKTQVCIVGGGPAGMLLGQILGRAGIETLVLERRSRAHVLSRIRAGVLEAGTVETLRAAGVGDRATREGLVHDGTRLTWPGGSIRIDFQRLTGRSVIVYGQTEVTRDLYEARDAGGAPFVDEAEDVRIEGADSDRPVVHWTKEGRPYNVACEFVAGCDGFHGISRRTIPVNVLRTYEKVYPFGWLGVLSETPPVDEELIYASHPDGFALCSMRGPMLSRYYIQCAADEDPGSWSDARFWDALTVRLPEDAAECLVTGPSIEKSVAPLRSFVAEPMRWGRLFLAGDAAHIVPPTGAKGLNLAVGDVRLLADALIDWYAQGESSGLDAYSCRALARVWKTERFSWWMTMLMHRLPDLGPFQERMQSAELSWLGESEAAQTALAENYVGLPL